MALLDQAIDDGWFQSTPPRGRRQKTGQNQRLTMFQSTPPRGRRLNHDTVSITISMVSIHASTWEATLEDADYDIFGVSIHASTWEATTVRYQARGDLRCFNPRLHVGGDPARPYLRPALDEFKSPPPRGRRLASIKSPTVRGSFNPRLHVGGDSSSLITVTSSGFNPRLHVGGDPNQHPHFGQSLSFNPRLHVGGDYKVDVGSAEFVVSIHASTWEATKQDPIRV